MNVYCHKPFHLKCKRNSTNKFDMIWYRSAGNTGHICVSTLKLRNNILTIYAWCCNGIILIEVIFLFNKTNSELLVSIISSSPYFQNKNKCVITVWKQIMCVCRKATALSNSNLIDCATLNKAFSIPSEN